MAFVEVRDLVVSRLVAATSAEGGALADMEVRRRCGTFEEMIVKVIIAGIIELDDGKICWKTPYFMGKSMVSCRFSLKPIH